MADRPLEERAEGKGSLLPPLDRLWRSWPLRVAASILAFALLIALGWFSRQSTQELIESNHWVLHTQEVLYELEQLLSTVMAAETGQRGFALTGEERFLDQYQTATRLTPERLARVRELTSDNANQQRHLDQLAPLIEQRFGLLATNLADRQTGGFAAMDITKYLEGSRIMDEIHSMISAMTDEERSLFETRRAAQSKSILATNRIVLLGTAVSILILSSLFYLMLRELQGRRRAETALQTLNSQLEQQVEAKTEQLRASMEELRRSAETLSAVIKGSPLPIMLLDSERHVMMWNVSAERVFGYAAEEVVGGPCPIAVVANPAEFDRLFDALARGQNIRGVTLACQSKTGTPLSVICHGAPLHDASRKPQGMVFILEDVTARRLLEQQLRHAQKMEAMGHLTGGLAHDFNNLLGVIVGNLDLLQDHVAADPETAEIVRDALDGATRGAELVRRLLAFARRQPLQPKAIDINGQLTDVIALLRRTLGESISIELVQGKDLWRALIDPVELEHSILNLAINARDAMPNGGRLVIESSNAHLDEVYAAQNAEVAPGDYVMIAITDNGVGMSPAVAERAFEPFFTTKEIGQGTGLGLSMVYGFIRQSRGHIKIYSEPGHGTTVRLYVPRLEAPSAVEAKPKVAASAQHPIGAETILLVEDNADVRRTIARQLGELGYRVREAKDGQEALQMLDADTDLLFTDVVMPGGMLGYELAQRAVLRRPGLKILFTSGYAHLSLRGGSDLINDTNFLSKPFRKRELAMKLRSVLEPESAVAEPLGHDA